MAPPTPERGLKTRALLPLLGLTQRRLTYAITRSRLNQWVDKTYEGRAAKATGGHRTYPISLVRRLQVAVILSDAHLTEGRATPLPRIIDMVLAAPPPPTSGYAHVIDRCEVRYTPEPLVLEQGQSVITAHYEDLVEGEDLVEVPTYRPIPKHVPFVHIEE